MVFRITGKMCFDLHKNIIILILTSPASRKRRNTAGGLITGAEKSAPVFHLFSRSIFAAHIRICIAMT